jgi:superfamily II DNA/RNA helicase
MRFEFFKRKFWDEIYNSDSMKKLVIFTRTYFEFLKIKEFLSRVNASADYISEHTKKPKVQSKIAFFNANKYRILLTT